MKARRESANTSRFIAEQVALSYANTSWENFKRDLSAHISEDVRAELVNLSRLFRRHIIGAAGSKTSPTGTLTTVAKGAGQPSVPIASGLPSWAPRDAKKYMSDKHAATGSRRWFDNTGWVPSVGTKGAYPRDPGYLKAAFTPGLGRGSDIWEDMFGPIGVRIVRDNRAGTPRASLTGGGQNVTIQLAKIYVMAMGKIDLNMLTPNTSGNAGLSRLVHSYDPKLGVRLGTMNNGVYRPTLEPFINFFLTRALPHAVNQRLLKGTLGSLFRR